MLTAYKVKEKYEPNDRNGDKWQKNALDQVGELRNKGKQPHQPEDKFESIFGKVQPIQQEIKEIVAATNSDNVIKTKTKIY